MIARLWHGRVPTEKADAYLEYLNTSGLPDYRATPGNHGVTVLRRAEGEVTHFLLITHWESWDAIDPRQFRARRRRRARGRAPRSRGGGRQDSRDQPRRPARVARTRVRRGGSRSRIGGGAVHRARPSGPSGIQARRGGSGGHHRALRQARAPAAGHRTGGSPRQDRSMKVEM